MKSHSPIGQPVIAATPADERYHSLDSLRAAMMLLGIYIHAIAPFSTIPDVWWYRDRAASAAFDIQLLAIHAFRMPVFFAMGGFFGALLLARRGARKFAANRATRILLPLAACLALFIPLLKVLQLVQRLLEKTGTVRLQDILASLPRLLSDFNSGPYWFLLYLVYFYLLVLLLRPFGRRILSEAQVASFGRAFAGLLSRSWAPSFLAIFSIPGLFLAFGGVFPAPQTLLPEPRILIVYSPFIAFGWALYHHRRELPRLLPAAWAHLGMGLLWMSLTIVACIVQLRVAAWQYWAFFATVLTGALCVWEMLFALLGLFQRYLGAAGAWLRYASDSSYWLYLIHSPVLLFLQLFTFRAPWPGSLKVLLTLLLAVPVLFVSYHWLVRSTWLGAWLNGRRYPRKEAVPQANVSLA